MKKVLILMFVFVLLAGCSKEAKAGFNVGVIQFGDFASHLHYGTWRWK